MLIRGLNRVLGSRWVTTHSRDPSINYEFRPADKRDKGTIMDLTLNHFIYEEPHSAALGITRYESEELFDYHVSLCLHYPFCYTIKHRESGKTIGFRLMSVAHRDYDKDFSPFELNIAKYGEGNKLMINILEALKAEIWKLRPEADKILRRDITFVLPGHQRQGIAQHLLHLGLDFDQLRTEGYDGLQSEASSKASQNLLAKNGYQLLLESENIRNSHTCEDGQPINFPDETNCIQLYYLPL